MFNAVCNPVLKCEEHETSWKYDIKITCVFPSTTFNISYNTLTTAWGDSDCDSSQQPDTGVTPSDLDWSLCSDAQWKHLFSGEDSCISSIASLWTTVVLPADNNLRMPVTFMMTSPVSAESAVCIKLLIAASFKTERPEDCSTSLVSWLFWKYSTSMSHICRNWHPYYKCYRQPPQHFIPSKIQFTSTKFLNAHICMLHTPLGDNQSSNMGSISL